MSDDRRTTLDGDQITDGTIQPRELDTVQQHQALLIPDGSDITWDKTADKMNWVFKSFGKEKLYVSSEGLTVVSSIISEDKINYVTPTLPAGTYRYCFTFEADSASNNHGFISKFTIDGTEYSYNGHNHTEFISYTGFVHLEHLTDATHTVILTIASNKVNKTVSIRRARIEIWRV